MTNLDNTITWRIILWIRSPFSTLFAALIAIAFLACPPVSAAPRFVRIGVANGLSDHTVTSILQDSMGYMWFGTSNGLNRYDGTGFTVYKHEDGDPTSISDSYILSIYEDSKGTLWVGTQQGGLNRFNREENTFTHMLNNGDKDLKLSDNRVNTIFEDSRGMLWIGTLKGLNCYDPSTDKMKIYYVDVSDSTSLASDNIGAIYEDETGRFWIGTGSGLSIFDRESGTAIEYHNEDTISYYCGSIVPGKNGTLWVSNWGGGLHNFDPETGKITAYRNDPEDPSSISGNFIGHLALDQTGKLWIGTGSGLCSFDEERGVFTRYRHDPDNPSSLSTNGIWPLYFDRTGILWVGTLMGGLNKLPSPESIFEYYPNGSGILSSNPDGEITSFLEDRKGRFWIGSRNGVLKTDKNLTKAFSPPITVNNKMTFGQNHIYGLFEDSKGRIWAGTGGNGLQKYDEEKQAFFCLFDSNTGLNSYVTNIVESHEGNLCLGLYNGMSVYSPEENRELKLIYDIVADSLLTSRYTATALYEKTGHLWLGNPEGLNIVDLETYSIRHLFNGVGDSEYSTPHKIPSLAYGPDDTILLGTDKGMLEYSSDTEEFHYLFETSKVQNEPVTGTTTDDEDNIWFTTNTLLGRYSTTDKLLRTFGKADGVPFSSITGKSIYRDRSGHIYVGGLEGFFRFSPSSLTPNTITPTVVITSFKKFNREFDFGKPIDKINDIRLSYNDTFISLSFAALDYTAPEKNVYAYMMEGFDQDWVYIGSDRDATYTNLKPGSYTFRVKAANSDGYWNDEGTSLHIVISPPFWQRWWFRLTSFFAIVAVILSVHYTRVMMINRQRIHLQKVVDEQTKSLQAANEKLEQMAITDELTGLYNRRYFNEFLAFQWKDMARSGSSISVLLCDIDHFKNFNDFYGHLKGDECLKAVSGILKECTNRPGDIAARYGGEEFIIVLPDTSEKGAFHVAESILDNIRQRAFHHEASPVADYVTLSMGIATMFPQKGCNPELCVLAADQALYKAKEHGRNRIVAAGPEEGITCV